MDYAALRALRAALGAIRCAAALLVAGTERERDRGIGVAILNAVNAAEKAMGRLGVGKPPAGPSSGVSLN